MSSDKKLFWLVFIIGIWITMAIISCMFVIGSYNYEKGYKDAVNDFYNGKLKMERIEKNVVEYKWIKNK